jgi:large subunit ribosomal protein L21
MKYAIIKTGGKQYKVKVGDVLSVELLGDTKTFIFEEVLLVVDGDEVKVGMPVVEGVKVFADVMGEVKAEKIEVFKYKSKSRYRKHTGHRQHLSQVKITGIGDKPEVKVEAKPAKAVKAAVKAEKVVEAEVVAKPAKKVAAKKPATKKAAPKKAAK